MSFISKIHYINEYIIEIFFSFFAWICYVLNPISKLIINEFLRVAGIEVNGDRPQDLQVKDDRFYGLVIAKGVTGNSFSYIEGYTEVADVELFLNTIFKPTILNIARFHPYRLCYYLNHKFFDVLTPDMTKIYTNEHYEHQANALDELFGSQYSATLVNDLEKVEEANLNELEDILEDRRFLAGENIAKKLKLEPGMKVLDIGCGFGALAKHLAEKYKVHVTGVTICREMAKKAEDYCKNLPVKIIHNDYRAVTGKFDRIVSIEMFDHVGENHHKEYFEKVNSLLVDDGIFVFQTHCFSHNFMSSYDPFLEKCYEMFWYFSGLEEIASKSRGLLIIEHVQHLGYNCGVMSKAILRKLKATREYYVKKYSEKEYRRIFLYLNTGTFLGLNALDRVYQIVFSKNGLKYIYQF